MNKNKALIQRISDGFKVKDVSGNGYMIGLYESFEKYSRARRDNQYFVVDTVDESNHFEILEEEKKMRIGFEMRGGKW